MLSQFGAHVGLATLLATAVSACGGNTKARTGETHTTPLDASVDADGIDERADASLSDASMATGSLDDGAVSSNNQQGATTASGGSSAFTSISTTTSTANGASTTTNGSTSDLRPGWVAIEPVADGLSNCSARLDGSESLCTYSVLCGSVELGSRCELHEDAWDCSCRLASFDERTYTLTGALEVSACEVSLELCSPQRRPDPTPTCETTIESNSDGACVASEQCRTPAELSEGVEAVILESHASTQCTHNPIDGSTLCQCLDSGGNAVLYDVPLEQACTSLVPFCKTGFPMADETTELECTSGLSSQSDGFCQIERLCGPRMDLEAGYAIFEASSQWVECDESSGCTCSGTESVSAQASGDINGDRCDVMAEFCQGDVTAVPTGPVSISSIETQGGDNLCTGSAIASQWATWADERSVGLQAVVSAECVRGTANTWSCSCDSGTKGTDAFETEGLNFNDTCAAALDRCTASVRFVATNAFDYSHGGSLEFVDASVEADAGP